jgi:hypothetical protein
VVLAAGKLTLRSSDGSSSIILEGGNVTINGNVLFTGSMSCSKTGAPLPVALVGPGSILVGLPAAP